MPGRVHGNSGRTADPSLAKISENLGSRFVVLGAARIDEILGLAKPFLGSLDHLRHSILPLSLLLRRFASRSGFALLLFFRVMIGAKGFGPFKQFIERAVQRSGWPAGPQGRRNAGRVRTNAA